MLTTPAIGGRATVRIPTPSRSNPHSPVARLPHHCGVQTRGFLPWRLSDAGPRARGTIREGPASETLHNRFAADGWSAPDSGKSLPVAGPVELGFVALDLSKLAISDKLRRQVSRFAQ